MGTYRGTPDLTGRWRIAGLGGLADSGGGNRGIHGTADGDECGDGRAALEAIREHEPAVALLDYRMPELDGLAVVTAVARDQLPTRVLLLSATEDPATVYEALAAGAAGYLTKESDRDEIVAAVISCAKGGGYVQPNLAGGLASELQQRSRGDATLLSPREAEVITLIAAGHSVPEIAEQLHLAPTTIRTHVQRLYEKLGVSDRGAAVAEAMRRRLAARFSGPKPPRRPCERESPQSHRIAAISKLH